MCLRLTHNFININFELALPLKIDLTYAVYRVDTPVICPRLILELMIVFRLLPIQKFPCENKE